jgi:AraC-like DNA-binding protein
MGREALVGPGECVLMDSTEPYVIDCPGPTSALALRLSRPWLQYWVPDPTACATRTFGGKGWSAALCAALSTLGVDSASQLALPAIRVAEHIAGLLALAAGPNPEAMRGTSRLDDLIRALRDQLHEPNLTPDSLALQFDISKRYVHHLFAEAHTTFGEQLMRLRLERAHAILRDARCANLPIGEVAIRCGFTDPSHFARRFRLQFGQTPRDFRRTL